MIRITLCLTLLTVLMVPLVAFAEMNMKEGLWEITTSMDMPGMPFKMPPVTFKQCITKDKAVPQDESDRNKHNCKMIDQSVKGDTVRWHMECKEGKDKTTAKGEVTYKGTNFSGETRITTTESKGSEMTSKMSGRYLGPCDKKAGK